MKNKFAFALCASVLVSCLAASASATTLTLFTDASGTVRVLPELGIGPEVAPVGGDIQSSYFRTTSLNREIRRGFMEFAIPVLGAVTAATLHFQENSAVLSSPAPPVTHQLNHYAADLAITDADFTQATTFITTFETDANVGAEAYSFDVTALVAASQGDDLGFRVNLSDDLGITDFWAFGSGFTDGSLSYSARIVIDFQTVPEPGMLGLFAVGFAALAGRRRRA